MTDRSDGGAVSRVVRARQVRSFNQDVFGGTVEGVSVSRTGEVCAWASLHRDTFGAVVNAASLSELATPLVTLAGRVLGEVAGDTSMAVVPSVAITGAGSVSIGDPRVVGTRSSSQISMRGPSVITLPGDESAVLSAVISGARDVGVELGPGSSTRCAPANANAQHGLVVRSGGVGRPCLDLVRPASAGRL